MLIERTFSIGGWVCIASGVAIAAAILVVAPDELYALTSSAFLIGFGAFFLYVGRDAKRSRLELLASPKSVGEDESKIRR